MIQVAKCLICGQRSVIAFSMKNHSGLRMPYMYKACYSRLKILSCEKVLLRSNFGFLRGGLDPSTLTDRA